MSKNAESGCLHFVPEEFSIVLYLCDESLAFCDHFVSLDSCADNAGRNRVRKQSRPGLVTQEIDHFLGGCDETPRSPAHRLAQGGGDEVDFTMKPEEVRSSFAVRAHETGSVTLVHKDIGVILLGQLVDLVEGSDVAVHTEHAVRDDATHACPFKGFELLFQVGHVKVFVASLFGPAEAHSVDDRRVIEGIAEDGILWAKNCIEESGVSIKAAGKEDGVLQIVVVSDHLFEGLVDVHGSADEPD